MIKFRNKYRIATTRAPFWDYGWNGTYFVTLCTQNRINFFGHITQGKIILSDIGLIAQQCWMDIPNHFPFVKPDAFIIMPNHVHGIIIIDKQTGNDGGDGHGDGNDGGADNGCAGGNVETHNIASLRGCGSQSVDDPQTDRGIQSGCGSQSVGGSPSDGDSIPARKNKFGPQLQNLASIIRGFKIGVTKGTRQINPDFAWQPRYHDRIIRNEQEYLIIRDYIIHNPSRWNDDKFFRP